MDLEMLAKGWNFAGKTVVIPGGAGVLGGEMACALVKCGASVVILDRDLTRADFLKARLMAGPGSGKFAQADVLSKVLVFEKPVPRAACRYVDAENPACDTTTHTCVPCMDNSHWSGGTPYCDVASNTCVACLTNVNCGSSDLACDPATHACVSTCTSSAGRPQS